MEQPLLRAFSEYPKREGMLEAICLGEDGQVRQPDCPTRRHLHWVRAHQTGCVYIFLHEEPYPIEYAAIADVRGQTDTELSGKG